MKGVISVACLLALVLTTGCGAGRKATAANASSASTADPSKSVVESLEHTCTADRPGLRETASAFTSQFQELRSNESLANVNATLPKIVSTLHTLNAQTSSYLQTIESTLGTLADQTASSKRQLLDFAHGIGATASAVEALSRLVRTANAQSEAGVASDVQSFEQFVPQEEQAIEAGNAEAKTAARSLGMTACFE